MTSLIPQLIVNFFLSMAASYGASLLWQRKKYGPEAYGKKVGTKGYLFLTLALFAVSAGLTLVAKWNTGKATFAASRPTPDFVEALLHMQREEIQVEFTKKEVAEKILDEFKALLYREDADVNNAPEVIASILRPYMRDFGREAKASGIMSRLPSPVQGKNLYDWIEDCEKLKTEDGKQTRADKALLEGVKEWCDRQPSVIEDVCSGKSPRLPTDFESTDFFKGMVAASTRLLDNGTVQEYETDLTKIKPLW